MRASPPTTAPEARPRYFVNSLLGLVNLDLNTSRSLFESADLRKAVNHALDRRAIARANRPLATPTDQYLQSAIPGFRDTHVYPLTRSLAKARRLARGHRAMPSSMPAPRPRVARSHT